MMNKKDVDNVIYVLVDLQSSLLQSPPSFSQLVIYVRRHMSLSVASVVHLLVLLQSTQVISPEGIPLEPVKGLWFDRLISSQG